MAVSAASLAENQAWSSRLLRYAGLSQNAADVVTPGRHLPVAQRAPETRKFYTSRAVFNQAMTNARRELVQNVARADARSLLQDFATIRRAMKQLVAEVRRVFQTFREQDIDQALRRQATMHRKAAALRAAFATLNRHLDEVASAGSSHRHTQRPAGRASPAGSRGPAARSRGGVLAYGQRTRATETGTSWPRSSSR